MPSLPSMNSSQTRTSRSFNPFFLTVLLLLAALVPAVLSAQTNPPPQSGAPSAQGSQTQKPADVQQPAEAGGPQGDIGPMALPKKKAEDAEPAPPPRPAAPKKPEGMPDFSLKVDVPLVQVPVLVTTKDGQFIPGLKAGNFKVMEDGVEQKVTSFSQSEAPITAVLLVEFASTYYAFMYDALNASYAFASSLKPDDWIAVISYDMKEYILTDFTQDKRAVMGALNQLRIPGFSETNLYDALYDTLDRLDRIDGRKYIVLIASGRDTFSKINYDKILKKIQTTPNVGIFTISTGQALRMYLESRQGWGAQLANLDYLQADNQMATFARMTGGRWYHPRFEGELPEIYHDVAANIRNQYLLAYHPSNPKQDGSYRKLKVELVGPEGKPLEVKDQKGKNVKYTVIAREGYTAKHEVE